MKYIIQFVAGIVLLTAACQAQVKSVFIDFGVSSLQTKSPESSGKHWNNAIWGGAGEKSPLALVEENGQASGISVVKASGFLGGYDTGDNTQELYPSAAGKDRWSLERGKVDKGSIRFSGFQQGQVVKIEFLGVRDAPVEFLTKYASQGKEAVINCQNNRNKLAILQDLKPDSNGNIQVDISIVSGPNGHLSTAVLHIQDIQPDQNTTPTSPPQPEEESPESEETSELEALGLEEESSNSVLLIVGAVLIILGLLVIIGSVWYFLKPESE